jgi:hypothetical protein
MITDHPLKELWLLRYYTKGSDPRASLMDMSTEEAIVHVERYSRYRVNGSSSQYVLKRRLVEQWLVTEAGKLGTTLDNKVPLYFYLSGERQPSRSVRPEEFISVRAGIIPQRFVTFTFDDTFINHAVAVEKRRLHFHHPLHGQVLTARQVAKAIKEYGWLPSHDPAGSGPRYIEAQVWTRSIPGLQK